MLRQYYLTFKGLACKDKPLPALSRGWCCLLSASRRRRGAVGSTIVEPGMLSARVCPHPLRDSEGQVCRAPVESPFDPMNCLQLDAAVAEAGAAAVSAGVVAAEGDAETVTAGAVVLPAKVLAAMVVAADLVAADRQSLEDHAGYTGPARCPGLAKTVAEVDAGTAMESFVVSTAPTPAAAEVDAAAVAVQGVLAACTP